MPFETTIEVIDITVTFNPPDSVTFSGDDISSDTVTLNRAMALIRLTLDPQGTQAAFPTHPIQWTTNNQPVPQPEFCHVRRVGPKICILEVVNSVMDEVRTYFYVVVQDGSRFIGGDPTLLNMPPTPPTSPP